MVTKLEEIVCNNKMRRILPEGGVFGSKDFDEFFIELSGKKRGVFKRFEYLSLPFSITGNKKKFDELLQLAEKNGTSFRDELDKDCEARSIVSNVFNKMRSSPAFSKQVLDYLLGRVYIDDNILAGMQEGDSFEDHVAKVVVCWKQLADFYCIEGLVGGGGENNPFNTCENSSLIAGGLDSLETTLPLLKQELSDTQLKEVYLKLSSIIGRDYHQIDRAVDVLGSVFGKERKLSENELQQALKLINELSTSVFETNLDIGKFYNTFIRFHNWMPLALKQKDSEGSTYDSICVPTKKALNHLEESSEIAQTLSEISDATSPKGLALATLIDDEEIGDKEKLIERSKNLKRMIVNSINNERKKFLTFDLEDPSFYTGLVGGKWKGLKLLHDAKKALGLMYDVPRGFVISSVGLEKILEEEGVTEILREDIFSINEERRCQILSKINRINFKKYLPENLVELLGSKIIVRSSMYGEDGTSNFSGTYESVSCERNTLDDAMKKVVKSYFSQEAIKSREDIELSHFPGISVIIQERINGRGGVVHLTKNECGVSFAETPEEAVLGNGDYKSSGTIEELLKGTSLENLSNDLSTLHRVFGDIDIEFVIDNKGRTYLTQLRPKYGVPESVKINANANKITLCDLNDLKSIELNEECIVKMEFLGNENLTSEEDKIMDFIRKNKQHIIAIEGYMPSVAHIPNKIEGHFRIPYLFGGGKKR